MASRLNLQEELEQIPNIKKVYYQPPNNTKMLYPCIVYERNRIDMRQANNKSYLKFTNYLITVITSDPDDETPDILLDTFPRIRFDRTFKSDNLYHNVFTLYY